MSTITAFLGSVGSISPNALPTSFSYWPTPDHEYPPNVGDSSVVIRILVIRASPDGAMIQVPAVASAARMTRHRNLLHDRRVNTPRAAIRPPLRRDSVHRLCALPRAAAIEASLGNGVEWSERTRVARADRTRRWAPVSSRIRPIHVRWF